MFPLANRALTPDDQVRLLDAFTRLELNETANGIRERSLELANSLTERLRILEAEDNICGSPS